MKFLTLFTLTVLLTINSSFRNQSSVYICTGKDAAKYHLSKSCRGLNACTHDIIAVTKDAAKARGLGLCGWED